MNAASYRLLTRNRFLTRIMGRCFHIPKVGSHHDGHYFYCNLCGAEIPDENYNPDFSRWDWFGVLWHFVWRQPWGRDFIKWYFPTSPEAFTDSGLEHDINPDNFANLLLKYLKEERVPADYDPDVRKPSILSEALMWAATRSY